MNWGVGNMGSKTLSELNWDFSKMSSTTIFSIALLAVLVILLVVLVIVTIKVLSKGKKEDDEEYTERKYTSHDDVDEEDEDEDEDDEEEEPSDSGKKSKKDKKKEKKEKKEKKNKKSKAPEVVETGDGEDDEDEDEDEPEEASAPIREEKTDSKDEVAAVVEAALQAKAKAAELEARVAMEKAEQARAEAEQAARKASEAEAEARAASRTPSEEPEGKPEEESPEAPEEVSAAAEAPTQVLTEEKEDEDAEEDEFGNTDEIPVARVREKLKEQEEDVMAAKTQVANAEDIARAVKEARRSQKVTAEEDSAFGENAFPVEEEAQKVLDTSFDSAFTDPQLNQEMEERKEEEETPVIPAEELVDSAFGAEPEQQEEEIHSLQVAGDTITVNPVNAVNIHTVNADGPVQTTNPEAGINDPSEMSEFLSDNPVPKKEKKKMKKRDQIFAKKFDEDAPKIEGGRFLWYNNQDIEALTKKEDMYYYCHYFDDPADAVLPLIIEMYDCAFVRTEEIQKIAYGINYKSMGLREILTSKDDVSFDRSKITKDPTDQDLLQIRAKWVDYVDNFLQIIVIKAPAHMQEYIREQLYAYGENDVETLLFCPEPEDEDEE